MTNTFLCKIGVIPSPACSLCSVSDESLKHLFLSCHYTKNFWAEVIKWPVDHKVKNENLSDKDILFGIIGCKDKIFVNHILLLAEQYLYSCRQNKYSPFIIVFIKGCVMAVQFILFNLANCSPSIAMELKVSKEITCKSQNQRSETNKCVT